MCPPVCDRLNTTSLVSNHRVKTSHSLAERTPCTETTTSKHAIQSSKLSSFLFGSTTPTMPARRNQRAQDQAKAETFVRNDEMCQSLDQNSDEMRQTKFPGFLSPSAGTQRSQRVLSALDSKQGTRFVEEEDADECDAFTSCFSIPPVITSHPLAGLDSSSNFASTPRFPENSSHHKMRQFRLSSFLFGSTTPTMPARRNQLVQDQAKAEIFVRNDEMFRPFDQKSSHEMRQTKFPNFLAGVTPQTQRERQTKSALDSKRRFFEHLESDDDDLDDENVPQLIRTKHVEPD